MKNIVKILLVVFLFLAGFIGIETSSRAIYLKTYTPVITKKIPKKDTTLKSNSQNEGQISQNKDMDFNPILPAGAIFNNVILSFKSQKLISHLKPGDDDISHVIKYSINPRAP